MLHSPPFEGTIRIVNKGADVTILADAETSGLAFAASRKLAVCGISTAVLEAACLEPVDTRTLDFYIAETGRLLVMQERLKNAVQKVRPDAPLFCFQGHGEAALIAAVRSLLR